VTDGDAIHAKILAEPDEDVHRLAYADWLDEQGEHARAEFIRVQCELAREPEFVKVVGPDRRINRTCVEKGGEWWEENPRHAELRIREWELLEAHAREWFALPAGLEMVPDHPHWRRDSRGVPQPGIDPHGATRPTERVWIETSNLAFLANHPTRIRATIRRGFVESVACSGDGWARHGDAILAEHPVRKVTFTDAGPRLELGCSWEYGSAYHYVLAGREVTVPAGVMATAAGCRDEDLRPLRLVLSARWPQIPPEGWTFAPAAFDEDRHPRSEDGRFAPPFHIT